MCYRRELFTYRELLETFAWRWLALRKLTESNLEGIFGISTTVGLAALSESTVDRWKKGGLWERNVEDTMRHYLKVCHAYDVAERRLEGVQTRHGWHRRYEKMRHGIRTVGTGENCSRWFVLERPTGWLDRLKKSALKEYPVDAPYSEYDRAGPDRNEWIETQIADAVDERYGQRPYSKSINASYSPTGQWFAHVHARQVGQRVLVTWDWSLDV